METAIETFKSNPVEYLGKRVVTLGMMDVAHERPTGTAKRAFARHRGELREGEDFFMVRAGELGSSRDPNPGNPATLQPLLTETGYLLLVKVFRDAKAWAVQRDLVAGYFRGKALAQGVDPMVAMAMDQISHLHSVVCNFIQGSLAAHDRRIDGLQHAADERFAEVERQLKQLRRGSRVSAMGRASGRDRKVTPRAPKALAAVPSQPQLPSVKP